jgi:hypothetical protein
MPLDSGGVYRHNDQSARMHSPKEPKESEPKESEPKETEGEMTEVHNHGDGTFHTVHGGKEEQHESIGHMHAHLSKIHGGAGEKHFHAHHDGVGVHSHGVESGGEPDHREHEDTEGAKGHLDEALGDGRPMGEEPPMGEPAMQGSALGM